MLPFPARNNFQAFVGVASQSSGGNGGSHSNSHLTTKKRPAVGGGGSGASKGSAVVMAKKRKVAVGLGVGVGASGSTVGSVSGWEDGEDDDDEDDDEDEDSEGEGEGSVSVGKGGGSGVGPGLKRARREELEWDEEEAGDEAEDEDEDEGGRARSSAAVGAQKPKVKRPRYQPILEGDLTNAFEAWLHREKGIISGSCYSGWVRQMLRKIIEVAGLSHRLLKAQDILTFVEDYQREVDDELAQPRKDGRNAAWRHFMAFLQAGGSKGSVPSASSKKKSKQGVAKPAPHRPPHSSAGKPLVPKPSSSSGGHAEPPTASSAGSTERQLRRVCAGFRQHRCVMWLHGPMDAWRVRSSSSSSRYTSP